MTFADVLWLVWFLAGFFLTVIGYWGYLECRLLVRRRKAEGLTRCDC